MVKGGPEAKFWTHTDQMHTASLGSPAPDLVCFSHLRWDFVYQRPQHLMSRFAAVRRVHYVEEPIFEPVPQAHLSITPRTLEGTSDTAVMGTLHVVVPVLPWGIDERTAIEVQRELLSAYIAEQCATSPTFWFQTPMAYAFAPSDRADTVIYDCMDELSAFDGAPPALMFNEKQLLGRADLVFTGGRALFEAKQSKHPQVHCFPSSIDTAHFARARTQRLSLAQTESNVALRVGFAGVIDERMDIDLLAAVADARPHLDFDIVGPVVKVDANNLPQRANIHFAGMRSYADLPEVMAEWDVAIMPFAHNASTRYISPTKTPEYLAAGLPVVSTSIRDVARRYGDRGLVAIADDAEAFATAIDAAVAVRDDRDRMRAVDAVLAEESWDATWSAMATLERTHRARSSADVATFEAESTADAR